MSKHLGKEKKLKAKKQKQVPIVPGSLAQVSQSNPGYKASHNVSPSMQPREQNRLLSDQPPLLYQNKQKDHVLLSTNDKGLRHSPQVDSNTSNHIRHTARHGAHPLTSGSRQMMTGEHIRSSREMSRHTPHGRRTAYASQNTAYSDQSVESTASNDVDLDSLPPPGNDWALIEKIGIGTYADVYKVKHKHSGQVAAAKIISHVKDCEEEINSELKVFKVLPQHPNIPELYGIYLDRDPFGENSKLWIVMELCPGGTVIELVRMLNSQDKSMDELLIGFIIRQTLTGLLHLHKNGVLHRDVKGSNIMISIDGDIKLLDFGVSAVLKYQGEKRNTSVGTPFWMSPEIIACQYQNDVEYDKRVDVWSTGITMLELADGHAPLSHLQPSVALQRIPRDPPPTAENTAEWSDLFNDFVKHCLIKDYQRRPPVNFLLAHPFLSKLPVGNEQIKTGLRYLSSQRDRTVLSAPDVTSKRGRLKAVSQRSSRASSTTTTGVGQNSRSTSTPNDQNYHRSVSQQTNSTISIAQHDDLATLETLDEENILRHLMSRYNTDRIYTYIGDILLAINPFATLPIYGNEYQLAYRNSNKLETAPHVYAMADQSYRTMSHSTYNQCIVISGESGSGKTETANFLVQQLTLLGRAPNRSLEDRILLVNPLLEAFGNARTALNGNSSRFGKYTEMLFTSTGGKVIGAHLSEYLLEKTRVVHQNSGEKNFHVFYIICDALSHLAAPSEGQAADDYLSQGQRAPPLHDAQTGAANKYHLYPNKQFRYLDGLSGSGRRKVNSTAVNLNRSRFRTIQACFETIGFKSHEVSSVYSILCAILHAGNIEFTDREDRHSLNSSAISNEPDLATVSELLGVEKTDLGSSFTNSRLLTHGEVITKSNSALESSAMRDAMCKSLYSRLFSWIVHKINSLLRPAKAIEDQVCSIGILDIFGFEDFSGANSFEQLCINVVNEQLQYYFNQKVFATELAEYAEEGIEREVTIREGVEFVDNRQVLDMLLERPLGLLALMDEESHFPNATDLTLLNSYVNKLIFTNSVQLSEVIKFCDHQFTEVEYDASNFLEKNRDHMSQSIINILLQSKISLVRLIFQQPIDSVGNLSDDTRHQSNGQSASYPPNNSSILRREETSVVSSGASLTRNQHTVGTYFRNSLMDLFAKLVSGNSHFIRCIRPNRDNLAHNFDVDCVRAQLRYAGVLETVHIRKLGYAHRITFQEFIRRFHILAGLWTPLPRVSWHSCQEILSRLNLQDYALGCSKVFLKYYHLDNLERRFERLQQLVIRAQSHVRMWLLRRRFLRIKRHRQRAAIAIQRYYKGYRTRKQFRPVLLDRRSWRISQTFKTTSPQVTSSLRVKQADSTLTSRMPSDSGDIVRAGSVPAGALVQETSQSSPIAQLPSERVNSWTISSFDNRSHSIRLQAAITIQSYFRGWKTRQIYRAVRRYCAQNVTSCFVFCQQLERRSAQLRQHLRLTSVPVPSSARKIHTSSRPTHGPRRPPAPPSHPVPSTLASAVLQQSSHNGESVRQSDKQQENHCDPVQTETSTTSVQPKPRKHVIFPPTVQRTSGGPNHLQTKLHYDNIVEQLNSCFKQSKSEVRSNVEPHTDVAAHRQPHIATVESSQDNLQSDDIEEIVSDKESDYIRTTLATTAAHALLGKTNQLRDRVADRLASTRQEGELTNGGASELIAKKDWDVKSADFTNEEMEDWLNHNTGRPPPRPPVYGSSSTESHYATGRSLRLKSETLPRNFERHQSACPSAMAINDFPSDRNPSAFSKTTIMADNILPGLDPRGKVNIEAEEDENSYRDVQTGSARELRSSISTRPKQIDFRHILRKSLYNFSSVNDIS